MRGNILGHTGIPFNLLVIFLLRDKNVDDTLPAKQYFHEYCFKAPSFGGYYKIAIDDENADVKEIKEIIKEDEEEKEVSNLHYFLEHNLLHYRYVLKMLK